MSVEKDSDRKGLGASSADAAEEWRAVPDFEGLYEVSNLGRIKSLHRPRRGRSVILTGSSDKHGYRQCLLSKDGRTVQRRVHRIVCRAFNGEPASPDLHAAHLDGDKLKNWAENLTWATRVENEAHKLIHGTRKPAAGPSRRPYVPTGRRRVQTGESNPRAKLSADQVAEMRRRSAAGASAYRLAREYGVCKRQAQRIIRNERWTHA